MSTRGTSPTSDALPHKAKRPAKTRWNKYATHIIKLEMLKQEIGYKKLAQLLAELEPDEEEYLSESLATRVSRGTFTFALALQILRVLGVNSLELGQLPTKAPKK